MPALSGLDYEFTFILGCVQSCFGLSLVALYISLVRKLGGIEHYNTSFPVNMAKLK